MNITDFQPEIRKCTLEDLDKIMDLQEHICQTMDDTRLFVATSREENRDFLIFPNTIIGVFDGKKLIAYGSLVFPNDAPENNGWDLDWSREKISHCVTLDTIVVDPDYRGHGLQRTLIRRCVSYAIDLMPDVTVLTTVSPFNKYSLHNVQAEGFQILKRKEKYGGFSYLSEWTVCTDLTEARNDLNAQTGFLLYFTKCGLLFAFADFNVTLREGPAFAVAVFYQKYSDFSAFCHAVNYGTAGFFVNAVYFFEFKRCCSESFSYLRLVEDFSLRRGNKPCLG